MTHVKTSPYYPTVNRQRSTLAQNIKGDVSSAFLVPPILDDARRLVKTTVPHYNNVPTPLAIGTSAHNETLRPRPGHLRRRGLPNSPRHANDANLHRQTQRASTRANPLDPPRPALDFVPFTPRHPRRRPAMLGFPTNQHTRSPERRDRPPPPPMPRCRFFFSFSPPAPADLLLANLDQPAFPGEGGTAPNVT